MIYHRTRAVFLLFDSLFVMASVCLAGCGGGGSNAPTSAVLNPPKAIQSSGPYHIATWANDTYWAAGSVASPAQVAQLVSYAETGPGNSKALDDCKAYPGTCKSVFYFNPNRVYSGPCPSAILTSASESWFVHWAGYTDSAHRIYYRYLTMCGGASTVNPVWMSNDGTPGVQDWWRQELQKDADGYDIFFMDNTHARVTYEYTACLPYPSFCYTTQEVPDDAATLAGHVSFANALNHRNGQAMLFAFNSMDVYGRGVSYDVALFNASPRFAVGICEGCAITNGTVVPISYSGILNTMAATNKTLQGVFVLHSTDSAATGSSTQIYDRLITTGLVWLGYSEGHTVVWADLEDATKNLSVWPEDLIYPSGPLQSMISGANDLEVSPGVYRREFATCYQAGVSLGPCGVIVNSTASNLVVLPTWLTYNNYRHIITLSGGDVLSGGVADIAGGTFIPGVTVLPANGAQLLAP